MAAATPKQDWILRAAPCGHVERIEAYFGGHGYDMHRHDTYAIGRTLSGVQSFTDQSHLTHRHVQTYGMTPDRWRRMLHA